MDNVFGQEIVIDYLRRNISSPPHLIINGPTGVGKSMLANTWITEQLHHQGIPIQHHSTMTLSLSSADDRGIAAIRQRLTDFVRGVFPVENATAWVLFDDADNIPIVTQQALRRIMELNAHRAKFCFVSGSCDHFIEPIQSRCVILRCKPVDLYIHGKSLIDKHVLSAVRSQISDDDIRRMVDVCYNGNARQFILLCRGLEVSGDIQSLKILINGIPVSQLLRLQNEIIKRDINSITGTVLGLWSKGFSFEDCIDMLHNVVITYNDVIDENLHYVLQVCAEGHIYQIMNRMTTLDLIAVLSGRASSECLAEAI